MHFFFVSRGMKIIGVQKQPAQAQCQQLANSRLPGTRRTHQQENHKTEYPTSGSGILRQPPLALLPFGFCQGR
jgi:hypothetical protein